VTTWLDYEFAFVEGDAEPVHIVEEDQPAAGARTLCGKPTSETAAPGCASVVIGELSEHGVCEKCLLRVAAADDVIEGHATRADGAALLPSPLGVGSE